MLRFEETAFWVLHRGKEYGPFDYQWSKDLHGIELMFDGDKFGEFIGQHQLHADLSYYQLPRKVATVASIVLGSVVYGIRQGWNHERRIQFAHENLRNKPSSL
ncbi:hypothetical protein [Symmachiella dynata]|uniref:Uncharacterized protein n=1 Tax=Symmachiella dynata TaxID=2527995 RepID=A0A517ZI07_9PLAN|nr:hypothetical protein [Symmachiella dynata]QDU42108.1 hypothetical protein Mal52_05630 [Symmachiella dynata]